MPASRVQNEVHAGDKHTTHGWHNLAVDAKGVKVTHLGNNMRNVNFASAPVNSITLLQTFYVWLDIQTYIRVRTSNDGTSLCAFST